MVADSIGHENIAAVRTQVDEVYEFLASHLIPHARAEDDAPYPSWLASWGSPLNVSAHAATPVPTRMATNPALARCAAENAHAPVLRSMRVITVGLGALKSIARLPAPALTASRESGRPPRSTFVSDAPVWSSSVNGRRLDTARVSCGSPATAKSNAGSLAR
jgi:hypothetical protein